MTGEDFDKYTKKHIKDFLAILGYGYTIREWTPEQFDEVLSTKEGRDLLAKEYEEFITRMEAEGNAED